MTRANGHTCDQHAWLSPFVSPAQEMRTWKQAEDAGKNVGFDLVMSMDLADASVVSGPWWVQASRLQLARARRCTYATIWGLHTGGSAIGSWWCTI